jgi:hypothetical protein
MDAGFVDLVCFPSLVTLDRPGGSIWSNRHFCRANGAPESPASNGSELRQTIQMRIAEMQDAIAIK